MSTDANDETATTGREDSELTDAARAGREYVRERLHAELGRAPTDAELDEWLREHTEGY
jgi:hypothetical protein